VAGRPSRVVIEKPWSIGELFMAKKPYFFCNPRGKILSRKPSRRQKRTKSVRGLDPRRDLIAGSVRKSVGSSFSSARNRGPKS